MKNIQEVKCILKLQSFVSNAKNWLKQQHSNVFVALCSVDQLEILHGGIIQAETATVMMML